MYKDGMTALMFTVVTGDVLAMKALLEAGADAGQVNKVRKRVRRTMRPGVSGKAVCLCARCVPPSPQTNKQTN
jgi:ankyrin repeat protein